MIFGQLINQNPERFVWYLGLSGAVDAAFAFDCRFQQKRQRLAEEAFRQKEANPIVSFEKMVYTRRSGERTWEECSQKDLARLGEIRDVSLQQSPCRMLYLDWLSDGLSESQLSE